MRNIDGLYTHPLVRIDPNRVRVRAYLRSIEYPGAKPEDNWFFAEDQEMFEYARALLVIARDTKRPPAVTGKFDDYYESVFTWREGEHERRVMLGTREHRECSICGRATGQTSFKGVAHVLPELLGTGDLATWDECRDCNHESGRELETDLGDMLLGHRALMGHRSKGGTPKLKLGEKGPAIGGGPRGAPTKIVTIEGDPRITSTMSGPNAITISAQTPGFRPARVARALAKIAWQCLPSVMRADFDAVRKYVRGESDWKASEFYTVGVPGLRRVTVGVWRKVPGAPASLPPLVTLVSTVNTVFLWFAPELATGEYFSPIFPLLLKSPSSNEVKMTRFHVEGDERIRRGGGVYELGFSLAVLVQTRDAVAVRVQFGASKAASFEGRLTTPLGAAASDLGRVVYEVRSDALIGVLRIEREMGSKLVAVHYHFDVAPNADVDASITVAVVDVASDGAELCITDLNSGVEIVRVQRGGTPGDFDRALLSDGLQVALDLALLRERLGVMLPFPGEFEPGDRRTLAVLAGLLRHGVIRERTLNASTEIKLEKSKLLELIAAIDDGRLEFFGRNDIVWELLGTVLNPGSVRLVLEDFSVEPGVEDLRGRAAELPADGSLSVTLRFDSVRHELEGAAPGTEAQVGPR